MPKEVYIYFSYFRLIGTIIAVLPAAIIPLYANCEGIAGRRLSIRGYLAFLKSMEVSSKDACDFIADVTIENSAKKRRVIFVYALWLCIFLAGSYRLIVIGTYVIALYVCLFTYYRGKRWRNQL